MPSSVRSRLVWSLREALVVAGIFAAWALAFLALRVVLGVVMLVFSVVRPPRILGEVLFEVMQGGESILIPVVTQGAMATVALYVLARAGIVIVDHYRGDAVMG